MHFYRIFHDLNQLTKFDKNRPNFGQKFGPRSKFFGQIWNLVPKLKLVPLKTLQNCIQNNVSRKNNIWTFSWDVPLKFPNGENGDFHILKFDHSSNQKFCKKFFEIFRVLNFDFSVKMEIWPIGGAVRPTNFLFEW